MEKSALFQFESTPALMDQRRALALLVRRAGVGQAAAYLHASAEQLGPLTAFPDNARSTPTRTP